DKNAVHIGSSLNASVNNILKASPVTWNAGGGSVSGCGTSSQNSRLDKLSDCIVTPPANATNKQEVNISASVDQSYAPDNNKTATASYKVYVPTGVHLDHQKGKLNEDNTDIIRGEGFLPDTDLYYQACGGPITPVGVKTTEDGKVPGGAYITIHGPSCHLGENDLYVSDSPNPIDENIKNYAEIKYNITNPQITEVSGKSAEYRDGTFTLRGTGFEPDSNPSDILITSNLLGTTASPDEVTVDANGNWSSDVTISNWILVTQPIGIEFRGRYYSVYFSLTPIRNAALDLEDMCDNNGENCPTPGQSFGITDSRFIPNTTLNWTYAPDWENFIPLNVPDVCKTTGEDGKIPDTCRISLPFDMTEFSALIRVEDTKSNTTTPGYKSVIGSTYLSFPNLALNKAAVHPGDTFTLESGSEKWGYTNSVDMISSNTNFAASKTGIAVNNGLFGPETFNVNQSLANHSQTQITVNAVSGESAGYSSKTASITAYMPGNAGVEPSAGRPTRDVTIHGSGFLPDAPIYWKSPDCGQGTWRDSGARSTAYTEADAGGDIPNGTLIPLSNCTLDADNTIYLSDSNSENAGDHTIYNTLETTYTAYRPFLGAESALEHVGGNILIDGAGFTPGQQDVTVTAEGGIHASPAVVSVDAEGKLTPPITVTASGATTDGTLTVRDPSYGTVTLYNITFLARPILTIDQGEGSPGTVIKPQGVQFLQDSPLTWEMAKAGAKLQNADSKAKLNANLSTDGAVRLDVPEACQKSELDGSISSACEVSIPISMKSGNYTIYAYDGSNAPLANKAGQAAFKVIESSARIDLYNLHRGDTFRVSSETLWETSKKVKIYPKISGFVSPASQEVNVSSLSSFDSKSFKVTSSAKNGDSTSFIVETIEGAAKGYKFETKPIKVFVPNITVKPIGDPPTKIEISGGGFLPGSQIYWKGCISDELTPIPGLYADENGNIPEGTILDLTQCTLGGPLVFSDSSSGTGNDDSSVTVNFQIPNFSGTGIDISIPAILMLLLVLMGAAIAFFKRETLLKDFTKNKF
ncbi:MAG: hypothetical protein LBB07_03215, partial [Bifidobacteriaceae bacterium]|nr:hypothetical protein [Bifidobacteriaceae bacterium]